MNFSRASHLLAVGLVAAATAMSIASAGAAPVGGATYSGSQSSGARIQFTLNSSASKILSYKISGVPGNRCTFHGQGDHDGAFPGIDIVSDAFSYKLYTDSIIFKGQFDSGLTAHGTYSFNNPAANGQDACSSGTIAWTAATTASGKPADPIPPVVTPPTTTTGYTAPSAPAKKRTTAHVKTFPTAVSVRRSRTALAGSISSVGLGCKVVRPITLKHGSKTIATTISSGKGAFRFAIPRHRGWTIRVSVPPRRSPSGVCGAGKSRLIRL